MFNRGVGGWEGVRSGPLFFALIPGWHNNADKKKKNDCSLIIVPTIMIMIMMMVMMIMMVVGINNNQQKSIRIRTVTMGIGSTTLHRTRKWTNPWAMHFLHFPCGKRCGLSHMMGITDQCQYHEFHRSYTWSAFNQQKNLIPLQQRHCSVLIHINTSAAEFWPWNPWKWS